jgi:hypothetical protein
MHGYTIAALAGAFFLLMLFFTLTVERPHDFATRDKKKHAFPPRLKPSADEPTPDRSVTATPKQVRRARQSIPAA